MQLVFFGSELNQRAPEVVGVFYEPTLPMWVSLQEALGVLMAGHSVSIRPATETEMKRAERLIVLHEVGFQMAKATHEALEDTCEPEEVKAALTALRSALEEASDSMPFPALVDMEG